MQVQKMYIIHLFLPIGFVVKEVTCTEICNLVYYVTRTHFQQVIMDTQGYFNSFLISNRSLAKVALSKFKKVHVVIFFLVLTAMFELMSLEKIGIYLPVFE